MQLSTKSKQLPPQNFLAEEIIIGHLISNSSSSKNILNTTDYFIFILDKHKILYLTVIELYQTQKEIKILELIHHLLIHKTLNKIGGIEYLFESIRKRKSICINNNTITDLYKLIAILYRHYTQRIIIQHSYYTIQINCIKNISVNEIYTQFFKCHEQIINLIDRQTTFKRKTDKFIGQFLASWDDTIDSNKILFGFRDLDKITQGFQKSDLIILAGRPSMGKTSFALNVAYYHLITKSKKIYFFSLEMSQQEILEKLIALSANVPINNLQKKDIKKKEWKHLQKTCELLIRSQLQIDDEGDATMDYIRHQIQNSKNNTIIIIDYLQLITVNPRIENRTQEIGHITRELKILAKIHQCPIILLSQLNRNIENRVNKRPLLSDLRESGCIDHKNLPNIKLYFNQSKLPFQYIEQITCINKLYITDYILIEYVLLHYINRQYTYSIISVCQQINLTHNHQILTNTNWKKADQIKKQDFRTTIANTKLNYKKILELNRIQYLILSKKTSVYDIQVHESCNFISGTQIIHNSIEQDADLILMLYQETDKKENFTKTLDIIIAKHRNGPIGAFQLLFHTHISKFQSLYSDQIH